MAKPVIFAVDDDPDVLWTVENDLRREYGSRVRVMRASSGAVALDALRQLKQRNDPVALLLADQRMPEMTGVGFLEQAKQLYPSAKTVLLTAYADTDAAIQAINRVKIDYYLLKPWEPPEERMYPILQDLLDDWQADYRPPFQGVRVVGYRWSPHTHQVRDFLSRNQIPYEWLDMELSDEARRIVAAVDSARLPLVLFPDGNPLADPSPAEIAERVGLKTRAEKPFYDLIVVGGGPAGLAAGVYGASEGLRTVIIEREAPGGQAGTSSRIENYLGFPIGLSGAELARRAVTQAKRLGAEILSPQEVVRITVRDPYRIVHLADGTELSCHALILAMGVAYRTLDAYGCDRLNGAGVYYGASLTEAASCRDEDVYIVGGANSAGQAAMHFARYARNVTILVRGESLTSSMSQYLIDQIAATPTITVMPYTQVVEVGGNTNLETITLVDSKTGEKRTVPTKAMFIFIGAKPHTDWLEGIIERDTNGFIPTGPDLIHDGKRPKGWTLDRDPYLLESSVPGIFVAGDVRCRSIKRVASAVGEGAMSVAFVHQYLGSL
ncbi:MAG: FAD-dependent oxidoreductase [Anaerolineae bacterium]|nr:FAD-dependent oxidoreductase [Anaerolineae bacterium]